MMKMMRMMKMMDAGGKIPVPKPRTTTGAAKKFGSDGMIVDKVKGGVGNEDNNNNKANTIPYESGKRKNEEVEDVTSELLELNEGSYDLMNESGGRKKDFSVNFKEVDYVPFMLRRRIDLGEEED